MSAKKSQRNFKQILKFLCIFASEKSGFLIFTRFSPIFYVYILQDDLQLP